ncbi:ASCH domain-containing protein [Lacticaseibacillus camelliae]|nr:ASCH domain-containing protein [Lacticaseibacillus camelliae]
MDKIAHFFQQALEAGAIPADTQLNSAYAMGSTPQEQDELAALVLAGKKTATSSGFELYAKAGDPLPQQGSFDIVLNGHGEPVALTYTDRVEIRSFSAVDDAHAYREGEGDRTLRYWRRVHETFFAKDYHASGLVFDPATAMVVLESFHVIFPPLRGKA